jgi:hypothetical protein
MHREPDQLCADCHDLQIKIRELALDHEKKLIARGL